MRFFKFCNSRLRLERWSHLGLLVVVTTVTACSTTSPTQRRQLIFTNEHEELALAEVQYGRLLNDLILNYDPHANRIVRTVGQRLAQAAAKTNYLWEFVVIDAPESVNVWVMPGGKVGVTTGVFSAVIDEAGLAIIMAHTMAHAIARHQGEKSTRDALVELSSMGASFAPVILQQTFNLGTNLGVIFPFGRVQEEEGDYLGLLLAAKAGYDPAVAIDVWERVRHVSGDPAKPTEFLVAHPDYDTRRRNLEKWLEEALLHYRQTTSAPSAKLPALEQIERPPKIERAATDEPKADDPTTQPALPQSSPPQNVVPPGS
jgi:metalloendopeptidase OMA1, mitochondrial